MSVAAPILSVFGSCCACVYYLEYLAKESPGSMNLLTFAEFLFITIEGLIFTTKFLTVPNKIPYRSYLTMTLIFFTVNVVNNQALNFNIPVPLHIIFRSGSLLTNMLLGMYMLQRRYTVQKYLSVVFITIGIIVCTLASTSQKIDKPLKETEGGSSHLFIMTIGVLMLLFALVMSALLGIYQERLYTKFGKHAREALFFSHAIPLPFFLIFSKDIYRHVLEFNESEPYMVPYLNTSVPILWWYLILSVLTQYACIRSVYVLTSECPSLTVTLVVTLRKFISLIISIVWFKNPFTLTHWFGAVCVFGGTLMFADVVGQIRTALSGPEKTEKKTE